MLTLTPSFPPSFVIPAKAGIQEGWLTGGRGVLVAEDFTRYANDPVGFLTDVLGDAGTPYSKQAEMLDALVHQRRVSVVGANGSGKDWVAGRAMLWWLETRPEATALTLGPTQRQVEEIVWKEMREAYASAEERLSGRMLRSAYRIDERRFALGFSTNSPLNIQGFRSEELLVVVTEAHAMPQSHMDAIKRLHPNRLLLVGNALSRDGEFYDSHHAKRSLYYRMAISALDTPNFTGEDGGRRGMVTPEDVGELALDWGEDHPLYQSSVLAQFPDMLDDSLIGRDAVESAMERWEAERVAAGGGEPTSVVPAEAETSQPSVPLDCHSERSAAEPRNLSGEAPVVDERSPRDASASLNMTGQDDCHSERREAEPRNLSGGDPSVDERSPRDVSASLNMTGQDDCHSERREAEPRNLSGGDPAVDERSPRDASASLNMTGQDDCHSERREAEPRNLSGEAPVVDERSPRDVSTAPPASLNMTTLRPHGDEPVYMGVDVARFGFDKSVLCVRQGQRVLSVHSLGRVDTMRLVHEIITTAGEMNVTAIFVDEGGVGGGVVDRLRELGAPVYGVHFGGASRYPMCFFNRRSEIFWELRRLLHQRLIALPRDEELAGQLLALRYDVSSSGQVRLEGKREMRKRGMPSPDKADALALAFLTPPSFGIWTGAEPFPPRRPSAEADHRSVRLRPPTAVLRTHRTER